MSPSSSTLGQALDAKTGHLVATRKLVCQADDYLGAGVNDDDACDVPRNDAAVTSHNILGLTRFKTT